MSNQDKLIRFDWAIKHILRDKANFDILEGFLSAVLAEDVEVIQILESESDRELEHLKYNRVDILVKDSQDRQLIVEVQNQHERDYLHRMLFGASKVIIDTLQISQPYQEIAKVVSISILYFNLGSGNDYVYYGSTKFTGLHTHQPLSLRQREKNGNGSFYLREVNIEKEIFPEYFLIQVERFEDVINSPLDEWIYLLKNEEVRDDFNARNIDRAKEKLSVMQMSAEKRRRYERYMRDLLIERDVMQTAHREGHAAGLKEGLEEGVEEGLEKGRKEGHKEGLQEGLEKGQLAAQYDTARKMLAKGFEPANIADLTGLSLTEINRIRDDEDAQA